MRFRRPAVVINMAVCARRCRCCLHRAILRRNHMSKQASVFGVGLIAIVESALMSGCVSMSPSPPGTAQLENVITDVERALDQYQAGIAPDTDPLPPLQSADFDFKVTTGKTSSAGIDLLVFKL